MQQHDQCVLASLLHPSISIPPKWSDERRKRASPLSPSPISHHFTPGQAWVDIWMSCGTAGMDGWVQGQRDRGRRLRGGWWSSPRTICRQPARQGGTDKCHQRWPHWCVSVHLRVNSRLCFHSSCHPSSPPLYFPFPSLISVSHFVIVYVAQKFVPFCHYPSFPLLPSALVLQCLYLLSPSFLIVTGMSLVIQKMLLKRNKHTIVYIFVYYVPPYFNPRKNRNGNNFGNQIIVFVISKSKNAKIIWRHHLDPCEIKIYCNFTVKSINLKSNLQINQ